MKPSRTSLLIAAMMASSGMEVHAPVIQPEPYRSMPKSASLQDELLRKAEEKRKRKAARRLRK